MEAWEGEKLNNIEGRLKKPFLRSEEPQTKLLGLKRSPPALEKVINESAGFTYRERENKQADNQQDGDSSSDSSESSNSSSSSSSSSGGSTEGSRGGEHANCRSGGQRGDGGGIVSKMWERDDQLGEFIPITCAENEARLYKDRFARGSIGKCVWFRNRWYTPNEFQAISGRQSSKDWKRSIRLRGRCLKEYITDGLFKEHDKTCMCKVCLGGDVDALRQEGVMALAAKRRRLSQADGGHVTVTAVAMTATPNNMLLSSQQQNGNAATPTNVVGGGLMMTSSTEEKKLPGSTGVKRRGRPPGTTAKKKKTPRVWSPSGEVSQEHEPNELSNNKVVKNEASSDEEAHHPPTKEDERDEEKTNIIDASDFLPRRSKRSTHRKHVGHRTELGTYTNKPSEWDHEEVAAFLRLQGFTKFADTFLESEINGRSMFLLKEHHLLEKFSMKLGPALRLLDTINRLTHPPP